MAQPWTESAPIDFSDFGQAAAGGAIRAQEQFAEQSKNFSDLLTTNIDNVNRSKNTLQAIELLNSLDVDSSKDLFKSGNIMGNISQVIGTNNIDFNNEYLANALVLKQAAIKSNDKSNLIDLLSKVENYQLLKEDPQTLGSTQNLTLSTSEISKIQKDAKGVFGKRILREAIEDPKNFGRSVYDIEREIIDKYKDYVDIDEILKSNEDAQKWKNNANTNYSNDVVNNGIQQSMLANSNAKNPDGTPVQFNESRDLEVLKHSKLKGDTPEQQAALEATLLNNITDNIQRDDAKNRVYEKRKEDLENEKNAVKLSIKAKGKSRLTGANFIIDEIVDSFDTTNNPNASLGIDAYVNQVLPGKSGNNFRFAYNTYGAPLGISPTAFRSILTKIGVEPTGDFDSLDDFRSTLESNKAFQSILNDNGILASTISDLKIDYNTKIASANRRFKSDLYDIANTGMYNTYNVMGNSMKTALSPTEQNTIENSWRDSSNAARLMGTNAKKASINQSVDQTDFDIRTELGEKDVLPYFDNRVTQYGLDGIIGVLSGLGTDKWLKKFNWMAKNPKIRFIADALAATSMGTLTNIGQNGLLNWGYGNSRYKLDDDKVISFLDALDYKVKNHEETPEDMKKFYQVLYAGKSLSPMVIKRAKESLELQQSIYNLLNTK